jgi:hypothetical protein
MATTSLTEYLVGGTLPVIDGAKLARALNDAADEATTGGSGDADYLTFSGKTGAYALGRSRVDVDPGQLFLVETQTFEAGWICWKNSKPVGRHKWSVMQPELAIPEDELEDHGPYRENSGDGWSPSLTVGLLSIDNKPSQVIFSTSSTSGRNVVGDLMREVGSRAEQNEPHALPVLTFDKVEFVAQGQKNWKPVLAVETWVTRPAATAYLDNRLSEEELLAGTAPKASRAKKRGKK